MTNEQQQLDPATAADVQRLTEMALVEDIGSSDLEVAMDCTTLAVVPDDTTASAIFVSREAGVIAGLAVCELAIEKFAKDIELKMHVYDGDDLSPQQPIATMTGEARKILMMERTCLNFMCRLSGIATLSARFAKLVSGTRAKVLDTRKTTPGWRRIEKYAVACGGGANHRMGLYDAIMIKDNHIAMYGNHIDNHNLSVSEAVEMARTWVEKNHQRLPHGKDTVVQIEVDTLQQLEIALPAQPDIVLLDNMNNDQLREAVSMRDATRTDVLLEASGGVNLDTVAEIAKTGVERISVGALTHSAKNFDIGLDWVLDA